MRKRTYRFFAAALTFLLLLAIVAVGCAERNDGPAEELGEKIDDAVDDLGDAAEDVGEELEEAGEEMKEAIDELQEEDG